MTFVRVQPALDLVMIGDPVRRLTHLPESVSCDMIDLADQQTSRCSLVGTGKNFLRRLT